jgi:hypothetical protein
MFNKKKIALLNKHIYYRNANKSKLIQGVRYMDKNDNKETDKQKIASKPSSMGLRGRQSVRATFRLTEDCIDAISILSAHLGIKQKSVFDHMMDDHDGLMDMANDLADSEVDPAERIQKTFVISRRALSLLDKISDKKNAPRDALVEHSIRKLLPVIANERKEHEKRKELIAEISNHLKEGQTLLSKAKEILNINDPMVMKLDTAMSAYKHVLDDIVYFVEKGKMIEAFEPNE